MVSSAPSVTGTEAEFWQSI